MTNYQVAAVDDEQHDRRVVQRAGCLAGHELRCSPGSEREDGNDAQQIVPTCRRPADADCAMAAAMRNSGAADAGEWWAQCTLPRIASVATSGSVPPTEIAASAIA